MSDVEEFQQRIQQRAAELLTEIAANREKYLTAWVAETGLQPSECMLVEQRKPDGSLTVTVERRPWRDQREPILDPAHQGDPEQHRLRHAFLHNMLDELVSDFCMHNREARPSETTVLSLMAWSSLQARNPTPTR
jgi:hypothetical protein